MLNVYDVFSAPNRRSWIYHFCGFEYFENWLEWLEATSQIVFWEIDASKMIGNLEMQMLAKSFGNTGKEEDIC